MPPTLVSPSLLELLPALLESALVRLINALLMVTVNSAHSAKAEPALLKLPLEVTAQLEAIMLAQTTNHATIMFALTPSHLPLELIRLTHYAANQTMSKLVNAIPHTSLMVTR